MPRYNLMGHILGSEAAHHLNVELQDTEDRIKPIYSAVKPLFQPVVDAAVEQEKQAAAAGLSALLDRHVTDPAAKTALGIGLAELLAQFHITL